MVELAVAAAGRHPISRPLTAELVPSGLWWVNLRSILRPSDWDALRAAVYEGAGHRCEICGGAGRRHPVEAHEVWSWTGRSQRLVRLVALCPRCHFVKHAGRAKLLGRENDVIDQLRRVNDWTEAQARAHLKEAWNDWACRNAEEWEPDLSVLGIELTDDLLAWAQERARRTATTSVAG